MNPKLKGIVYITLSAVCFGSYGIWSRMMGNAFDDYSQAWIRGIVLLTILFPLGIITKSFKKVRKQDIVWFVAISVGGGFNQAPYFYAFNKLDIGTATLLFYASLTLAGYFWGKISFFEKLTTVKLVSLALAIIGLSMIFTFSLNLQTIFPALAAVVAGFMGGTEVSLSKKISHRYSTLQTILTIFTTMLIGNFLISAALRNITIPALTLSGAWVGEIGYTIAMLLAMYFVVIGFKYIEASVGSIVGLSEILFAALFGFLFFKEVLTFSTFIGGLFIICAAALPNIKMSK
ncbi:MAG TPA: hypothetical protein CFH84_05960 [Sulfurimonas sp. UBA12504]|nr:MAG TPA: hypothetical protein CFH84_05960 [Sulfurimonas sp. UBA12504]